MLKGTRTSVACCSMNLWVRSRGTIQIIRFLDSVQEADTLQPTRCSDWPIRRRSVRGCGLLVAYEKSKDGSPVRKRGETPSGNAATHPRNLRHTRRESTTAIRNASNRTRRGKLEIRGALPLRL